MVYVMILDFWSLPSSFSFFPFFSLLSRCLFFFIFTGIHWYALYCIFFFTFSLRLSPSYYFSLFFTCKLKLDSSVKEVQHSNLLLRNVWHWKWIRLLFWLKDKSKMKYDKTKKKKCVEEINLNKEEQIFSKKK